MILALASMTGPAVAGPATDSQRAAVTGAVSPYLTYPYSAVFGEMHVAKGPKGMTVCGAVNAKNKFGAFTGNAVFMIMAKADFSQLSLAKLGNSLLDSVPVLLACQDEGIVFSDEVRLPIARAMVGAN